MQSKKLSEIKNKNILIIDISYIWKETETTISSGKFIIVLVKKEREKEKKLIKFHKKKSD